MASPFVSSHLTARRQHHREHRAASRHLAFQDVTVQVRQRETSPQNADYYLIDYDALWRGIKPYVIMLRDLIMQNQPLPFPAMAASPPPSLSPGGVHQDSQLTQRVKMPSFATRRLACTHLTMERVYGNSECNNCGYMSSLGSLYSCTQDDQLSARNVDISEPRYPSPPNIQVNWKLSLTGDTGEGSEENVFHMPTPHLSPWIEKAIKAGHYTLEQIEALRAQKQKVSEKARATIEQFEQSQRNNTTTNTSFNTETDGSTSTSSSSKPSNSSPQGKVNASQSIDTNPHLPFPVIHKVPEPSTINASKRNSGFFPYAKLRIFPHCKYRVCQHCRPTFRDRTWQCFDEIFSNDAPLDLRKFEAEYRPLANAAIVRAIGLREPLAQKRPMLRALDSKSLYTLNGAGKVTSKNLSRNNFYRKTSSIPSSIDVTDGSAEPENEGFRESMKRTFRDMWMTRGDSGKFLPKMKSRNGEESSNSTSTEIDALEFDVGLWKELADELLQEASSVPLPTGNTMDGLAEDIEVVDIGGVGITEEHAETGEGDIILSV